MFTIIDKKYDPYKLTAIKRKGLSVPMRKLLELEVFENKSLLDFGCGEGEDLEILRCTYGIDIEGYDKYNMMFNNEMWLNGVYDGVTCNYVLNVIPDLKEHKKVIEKLRRLGKEVYISVRTDDRAIKDNWEYIKECKCWKTSMGSYQRFYTDEMVKELIGDVEYIINNKSLKLFKLL